MRKMQNGLPVLHELISTYTNMESLHALLLLSYNTHLRLWYLHCCSFDQLSSFLLIFVRNPPYAYWIHAPIWRRFTAHREQRVGRLVEQVDRRRVQRFKCKAGRYGQSGAVLLIGFGAASLPIVGAHPSNRTRRCSMWWPGWASWSRTRSLTSTSSACSPMMLQRLCTRPASESRKALAPQLREHQSQCGTQVAKTHHWSPTPHCDHTDHTTSLHETSAPLEYLTASGLLSHPRIQFFCTTSQYTTFWKTAR